MHLTAIIVNKKETNYVNIINSKMSLNMKTISRSFYKNYKDRKSITKLRISAHNLEIEVGRHRKKDKKRVPVESRICKQCKITEDEMHFIMDCKQFKIARTAMFDRIKKENINFDQLTNTEKFHYIMRVEKKETASALINYIKNTSEIRGPL
jgi:hypothetical protein